MQIFAITSQMSHFALARVVSFTDKFHLYLEYRSEQRKRIF